MAVQVNARPNYQPKSVYIRSADHSQLDAEIDYFVLCLALVVIHASVKFQLVTRFMVALLTALLR